MKKYAKAMMLVLGGALIATSFVGAQSQAGHFKIEVTATGTVVLKCTEGCNFKELSWTCSDTNQDLQSSVAVDESGMSSP